MRQLLTYMGCSVVFGAINNCLRKTRVPSFSRLSEESLYSKAGNLG